MGHSGYGDWDTSLAVARDCNNPLSELNRNRMENWYR
jgi:hypothetical protein